MTVDLSDRAKARIAHAQANQDAANRIDAFVDASRGVGRDRSSPEGNPERAYQQQAALQRSAGANAYESPPSSSGGPSLDQEYLQLTATQPSTISQASAPTPTTFSESLQVDGFSILASSNSATGDQSFEINGLDGLQETYTANPNGEVTISSGLEQAAFVEGSSVVGNNAANFTLTKASATAASVTSSTADQTVSAATASAEYETISFSVNFSTATIQVQQTEQVATETTAKVTSNTQVSKTA